MAGRKSNRLMFLAVMAGSGMLASVKTHGGTVIPGQDASLPPESPTSPIVPQPTKPAIAINRNMPQPTVSANSLLEISEFTPHTLQAADEISNVQIYPFGNTRPEQSLPLPPQSLGDAEHNAGSLLSLVAFADLFDRNLSLPSPGMIGVYLGREFEASNVVPPWQSIFAASLGGSMFSTRGNDEDLIYFPADFAVQLNHPPAIETPNDGASETASRSGNEGLIHAPLGWLSDVAVREINERVLQRIADLNPESKSSITPAESTDLTTGSDTPDGAPDRAVATASEDTVRVSSLVEFSSPSTGGGGGSSTFVDIAHLLPINLPITAAPLRRNSMIGDFRMPAVVSHLATSSVKTASEASSATLAMSAATSSALTTATSSGVLAAISLPAGILRYNPADFQPNSPAWVTSHISHLSGGRLGGSVGDATGNYSHAALWNLSMTGFVDVHPTTGGFTGSSIADIRGSQAVGIGSTARTDHALLWMNANPNSTIDLNPTSFKSSYALGTDGSRQIGYGYTTVPVFGEESHALLWNSSATDYVDLNPVDYIFTFAYGGDKLHQAGYGLSNSYNLHALLWAGTAQSVTDIQPTNGSYTDSRAFVVRGNRAGGYATDALTQYPHAILWTALDGNSAVDLHPAGFLDSQITALNTMAEVGYGRVLGDHTGNTHALLWTDRTSGVIDLNNFLPSRYISAEADGIDSAGNVVGWAKDSTTGNFHAVEWLAVVPEPTGTLTLAGLASLSFLRSRSRRKRIAL